MINVLSPHATRGLISLAEAGHGIQFMPVSTGAADVGKQRVFDCAQIKIYMAVFIGSYLDITDTGEKINV